MVLIQPRGVHDDGSIDERVVRAFDTRDRRVTDEKLVLDHHLQKWTHGPVVEFDKIHADPNGDTLWLGHPYRFWSSYLWYRPVDDLAPLTLPMFVAQGTADSNVPVESARALRDDFVQQGKTNLKQCP